MVVLNYCQKIGCPVGQPAGRQLHCLVRPSWGPGVCCFLTSALILRTLSSVSSGGPTSGPKMWVRLWFRPQKAPGESLSLQLLAPPRSPWHVSARCCCTVRLCLCCHMTFIDVSLCLYVANLFERSYSVWKFILSRCCSKQIAVTWRLR